MGSILNVQKKIIKTCHRGTEFSLLIQRLIVFICQVKPAIPAEGSVKQSEETGQTKKIKILVFKAFVNELI